ncbi:hypothetical protein VTK73DRAFT_923 [Phialemonium thermophilum]|uniref:Uncharacterized protein n=1 Tax=Phialemonium thermophilum TaxID=223376 RepID=A0ABR3XBZ2_9PEZI
MRGSNRSGGEVKSRKSADIKKRGATRRHLQSSSPIDAQEDRHKATSRWLPSALVGHFDCVAAGRNNGRPLGTVRSDQEKESCAALGNGGERV